MSNELTKWRVRWARKFDDADGAKVRSEAGPSILETCAGITLHQLLTAKDPHAPAASGLSV